MDELTNIVNQKTKRTPDEGSFLWYSWRVMLIHSNCKFRNKHIKTIGIFNFQDSLMNKSRLFSSTRSMTSRSEQSAFVCIRCTWWRHQIATFRGYWPFVRGIHRSPVNSPHTGQWRGTLMLSLIRAWINGWLNNREAGDLRRCRANYDVTVITYW